MNRLHFFPIPMLFGLGALVILVLFLWWKKRSAVYLFSFAIFWIYLMAVVSLTLFPIPLFRPAEWRMPVSAVLSRINWVPFRYGIFFNLSSFVIQREMIGNLLLTLPFGFAIQYIARLKTRTALLLVLAAGLVIELMQLIISLVIGVRYRTVDINDVILNTIGALTGFAIYQVLRWVLKGKK